MKFSEFKSAIKKGDIIIITSLVLITLFWFSLSFFQKGSPQVNIYLDGEIQKTLLLSEVKEEEIVSVGNCEIKVTKDGAVFLSSDCEDGLCVKRGLMKNIGDVMACVPEGVTVEITGRDSHIDGLTY